MKLVVPIMKEKSWEPEFVEVNASFNGKMKFVNVNHDGDSITLTQETWDHIFKQTKKMFLKMRKVA